MNAENQFLKHHRIYQRMEEEKQIDNSPTGPEREDLKRQNERGPVTWPNSSGSAKFMIR